MQCAGAAKNATRSVGPAANIDAKNPQNNINNNSKKSSDLSTMPAQTVSPVKEDQCTCLCFLFNFSLT